VIEPAGQAHAVERVRRGLDGAKVRGHQRAIPSFGRAREPRLGENGGPSTSSTLLELRSSIFANVGNRNVQLLVRRPMHLRWSVQTCGHPMTDEVGFPIDSWLMSAVGRKLTLAARQGLAASVREKKQWLVDDLTCERGGPWR
jgi:hypothetical protein